MDIIAKEKKNGMLKYLSPLGAWALAFGCSVGWGSFVMPGSTFLPIAGPLGTALGLGIAALVMLILGFNYHYLMNRYPDAGGTYTYTKYSFGYDHGFVCAWFLILTYVAVIWANATALPLIARNLYGSFFQFGFHYEIAGYHVYFGELLLAVGALLIGALICLRKNLAAWVQILMAFLLFGGVTILFAAAMLHPQEGTAVFEPPYYPGKSPFLGIFTIIALGPWAYVGFESISHSAGEFKFSQKKSFLILAVSLVTSAAVYILLSVLAVMSLPEGCKTWPEYISNLGNYSGFQGMPTLNAASSLAGKAGTLLLGLAAFGGIITGLVGFYIASSRLFYSLAQDDLMPQWLGQLDENGIPRKSILFIMAVSVILPFFGRTAISWIVDVTTVGATIAYAYASASALRNARKENKKPVIATGFAGLLVSLFFILYFLIPNLLSITTLSKESYLILSAWGVLGLISFYFVFKADTSHRLGRSTITWVIMLVLIIFTSTVWMRQETQADEDYAFAPLQTMFNEISNAEGSAAETYNFRIQQAKDLFSRDLTRNSLVLFFMIVLALMILFMIFRLLVQREIQIEEEKILAEESSRAKTSFLSNMSHEIRTPMNAIIGLDNIALKDPDLAPQTREQLEKIGASARHLLGLINDILDMSRIESGRMVLKEEEFPFRDFLDQINVMINGQCQDKGLTYDCLIIGHMNDYYIGDAMKLKQVLINILGNAVKFTPAPGTITFTAEQVTVFDNYCTLRFVMKDTGIGMSKEYIPKIFEAFSQEDSHSANKYGSTGLGMAITKNIVEMMNGEIEVESEKGVGTVFTVTVTLKASNRTVTNTHMEKLPKDLRLLVVDDDEVAIQHALLVANGIGITADQAGSGEDALGRVIKKREEGRPYQIIMTDYKMPGMDGLAFTRALRAFDNGETGVIIMTGYNSDDMVDEAKAAGVDSIISKPLFSDSLSLELHEVLNKHSILPEEATEQTADAGPEEEAIDIEGLHVLIAEDIELNAEILMDLLDLEGITADRAENGEQAVQMFSSHPEHTYNAILMDVRMPVMDGLEATRAIRALDHPDAKSIPIIAMTANAFDEDVQRSLQSGMTAHLSKPIEPERLYETLNRLAKRR